MSTSQAQAVPNVTAVTIVPGVPPEGYVPPRTLLRVRAESAAAARAEVRRALRLWGMRELIADAGLVADELVSNALAHTRAERAQLSGCRIGFTIRRVRQGVVIEVHDHGAPRPLPAPGEIGPADALRESGRGLFLVNALTDGAWGVAARPGGPGKVVWALLPAPAQAAS